MALALEGVDFANFHRIRYATSATLRLIMDKNTVKINVGVRDFTYEGQNTLVSHVEGKGCFVFVPYTGKAVKSESGKVMLVASSRGAIRLPNGLRLALNLMQPIAKEADGKKVVEAVDVDALLAGK
jgi:hypothetical protein